MHVTPFLRRMGLVCLAGWAGSWAGANDGNALTYLDEPDPFYVGVDFPKLTTPQWVGEDGVEAVVIIAIDDMRESGRFETFLRPVIERLQQIDGRAPVSIMSNELDTSDPHFQTWLNEGLSIDVHTLTHPCPLLQKGDFAGAAADYQGSIDLLAQIEGNTPVAYRMPCCDSINSSSPRFFNEIFNTPTQAGRYLSIDSSVAQIFTAADEALPKSLTLDADGQDRFRKYLPFPSFKTTIENYPYPYVIGGTGWELSCTVPSDWVAQNLHESNNPKTIEDWKAALDATVLKQGVFTMVIHTWGWVRSDQIVELIDYAEATYGQRVKFLNFPEALERLEQNVGGGESLRAADGGPNGVRLIDLNRDGFLDVVSGTASRELAARLWEPVAGQWVRVDVPRPVKVAVTETASRAADVRFGLVGSPARVVMMGRTETEALAWRFEDGAWRDAAELWAGLPGGEPGLRTAVEGTDPGLRLRDLDGDGQTELLVSRPDKNVIWRWDGAAERWEALDYALPEGIAVVDAKGRDQGLRFVDVNEDGFDDVIWSNPESFGLHLYVADEFLRFKRGWTREVMQGPAGMAGAIPLIVRDGGAADNGAWFHSGHLWVQNEDTAEMPDLVDRRSFKELLNGLKPPALEPEEALASFQLRQGFGIEVVAAEPEVQDPVAFDWGADGTLWVAEMGDYPLGLDGAGQPGGVVKRLTDRDGDGRYETATVFLDGLSFPNGVTAWGNGVLVSVAPSVLYAEDTDGDGRADRTEVLLSGFVQGNEQHRFNGFEMGLDGWWYGANGDSDGEVLSHRTGKVVDIRGSDFRFRPDTGEFEAVEGRTQFGRGRDDWGNWFGSNNPSWGWHYVYPSRYLARNPFLAVPTSKRSLAQYEGGTRVFPTSRLQQRMNDPHVVGHVTAANSPTPYRDVVFGEAFATSLFVSDPAYNLVHREVLSEAGASFTSARAEGEEEREFLSSSDVRFRPTSMKTGPDGALYIADMYRFVIEHPEWIPADTVKALDLREDADRGRIYRVFRKDEEPREVQWLADLEGRKLAERMDTSNGWTRDTVQRLMMERRDPAGVDRLEHVAYRSGRPQARLQALATLSELGALSLHRIEVSLKDSDSRVRRGVVRLLEPFLREMGAEAESLWMNEILEARVDDESVAVRQQLAFSLGDWDTEVGTDLLVKIARRDWAEEDVRVAILSALPLHADRLAEQENLPKALSAEVFSYREKRDAQGGAQAMAVVRAALKHQPRTDYDSAAEKYAMVTELEGSQERGKEVFMQLCTPCHRFRREGNAVGPDLDMLSDPSHQSLIQAIIDPNAAVEDKYAEVFIEKRDGGGLIGVISEETENAVTLRVMGGHSFTLLKRDIARMEWRGKSLMPDGFDAALSDQQMADLVTYLRLGK